MSFEQELEDIKKRGGITEQDERRTKQAIAAGANALAYLVQHGEIPPVSLMTPEEKKALQALHIWFQKALTGGGPGTASY